MEKLVITTPYGNRYIVHVNGDIQLTDMVHTPSGQWKLLGIQHVKRNEFIPLADIPARLNDIDLRYKNGNPQYTGVDLDHGSRRTWGNTKYHGIKTIYVVGA